MDTCYSGSRIYCVYMGWHLWWTHAYKRRPFVADGPVGHAVFRIICITYAPIWQPRAMGFVYHLLRFTRYNTDNIFPNT